METLSMIPLRTVHAYETDDDTVLEVELTAAEPTLMIRLEGRTLMVRVPRRSEVGHWHMNADVTGV